MKIVKNMLVDKEYVLKNKNQVIKEIVDGKIFIYPTDTIYGIGCNALDREAVMKIRQLKRRETWPFSVVTPGMSWIRDNCEVDDEETKKHLAKLPGPYTLFMKLKCGVELPKEVNPLANGTLGVRIPRHWFTDIVFETGIPFITTSVNLSGKPYMTSLDDLDESIKNNVDFIIYEGEIRGKESTKIDLTK